MARLKSIAARLQTRGPGYLNQLVRRALNSAGAVVTDSRLGPIALPAANLNTAGLFRLAGVASDRGRQVPWSLVLKVVRLPAGQPTGRGAADSIDSPTHYNYWKREPLAYQSGLLAQLSGNLAAPRCIDVEEQPGGAIWIWLEDVRPAAPEARSSAAWPLARYGQAARHLGGFQGRYRNAPPLPNNAWLSRGWLRSFLANYWSPAATTLLKRVSDPAAWEHPLVRAAFRKPIGEQIQRLWNERERLLLALERLPQTLCHFDFHQGNLFTGVGANGTERTLVIDWGFVGHGAFGEDIGHFLSASILFHQIAVAKARQLDEEIFQGYLAGLRDAGWRGDSKDVRLACVIHAALRWGLFAADTLRLAHATRQHAKVERQARLPIAKVLAQRALTNLFVLDLAEEAWSLLGDC